ncbi:MAG: glycosyltransferase [Oscillospiraceae bacterium]|nr:glycosyltransferase [Oscillospiraceae bacterium]
MKFSVLMSVYGKDDADFFASALESVTVAQTQKPAQVVIVQDGPVPERIDEIIARVQEQEADIEFTVVKKEKNAGLAAALNSGLAVCKYEWIARMDSDDISVPDRFEKQIDYLTAHPEVSVVGGVIAEFEKQIGDLDSKRYVKLTNQEIKAMAKTRSPMNHPSVMYLGSAVRSVGGYSEDFGKLEDYKLWVDLIAADVVLGNLDDVLVYMRVGNGFIARRSNKREIQDWDMLQEYLLNGKLINKREALINRIYIRVFIYIPSWLKKLAYKTVLRG